MEFSGTSWCMVESQWGLSHAFYFTSTSIENLQQSIMVELVQFEWKLSGMFGGLGTCFIVVNGIWKMKF